MNQAAGFFIVRNNTVSGISEQHTEGAACEGCHHLSSNLITRIESIESDMSDIKSTVFKVDKSVTRMTNAMLGDEQLGVPGYGYRLTVVEKDLGGLKAFKMKVIAWTGVVSAAATGVVTFLAKLSGLLGSGKG